LRDQTEVYDELPACTTTRKKSESLCSSDLKKRNIEISGLKDAMLFKGDFPSAL